MSPSSPTIFANTNQKFQQAATFSNFTLTGEKHRAVTLSVDPNQSDFPPLIQTIENIAKMKELVGADLNDNSDVLYPTPFDKTIYSLILQKIQSGSTPAEVLDKTTSDNLAVAYSAYINGDTSKVADYVPLLNLLNFPRQVAYFASSENCVLDDLLTVTGEGTVVLNCSQITFQQGGSIEADTEFILTCDQMIKEG